MPENRLTPLYIEYVVSVKHSAGCNRSDRELILLEQLDEEGQYRGVSRRPAVDDMAAARGGAPSEAPARVFREGLVEQKRWALQAGADEDLETRASSRVERDVVLLLVERHPDHWSIYLQCDGGERLIGSLTGAEEQAISQVRGRAPAARIETSSTVLGRR